MLAASLGRQKRLCVYHVLLLLPLSQFMNQTRQGLAMKMEGPTPGGPGLRAGMQPGMAGQVRAAPRRTHPGTS